mmetsp:Transcript_83093/g.214082  ORF Transcript_83093/g.214082 Transcript_83093/m.214082 type:complete len:148 (-) Transcript_83093:140-583(-)
MAPELLTSRSNPAGPSVDVFSLGKVLFFVASGGHTKSGHSTLQPASQLSWLPSSVLLESWGDVINACIAYESRDRPTMSDVYGALFFEPEARSVSFEPEARRAFVAWSSSLSPSAVSNDAPASAASAPDSDLRLSFYETQQGGGQSL